jgi:hypothetical protein
MVKKIIQMRQPDPEQPFDRQQKKEVQIKPQLRIGHVQLFEPGMKIQKIEQPLVFAGVNDTCILVQGVDFLQVVIIQIDFPNRSLQYFPGDIAVIPRIKVGEVVGCVSQQVIDNTAYSGPGLAEQGFEKLEKVHACSLMVIA